MIYGIDVGGTKIEIAVFDEAMQLVTSWRVPTPGHNYSEFISTISHVVLLADKKYSCKGIVGVGMPGLVSSKGVSLASNVPCINNKNIRQDLTISLERPVAVENDCRCFTLSEATGGAGGKVSRVVGIVIGTGIGGGVYLDGNLLKGRHNIIGEFGHIPLPAFIRDRYSLLDEKCECGRQGCIEPYVSGTGLINIYRQFLKRSAKSSNKMFSVPPCISAMRQGEETAKEAFSCYMDMLGYAVASTIHHYDPDIIVLGGGMSNIPEISEQLEKNVRGYLFKTIECPPVVLAKFGDSSGVRGAALLVEHSQSNTVG